MSDTKVRWGLMGTATIARKNWHAILNSGNGTITAVASRTSSRADQFISECQAQYPYETTPQACGKYDELLSRDDVDAIYIPLPTGLRKEWVLKAASAGKHVMCEKPCAVSAADLNEMTSACRENNVQFMDGVMYMHSARMEAFRKEINAGSIGEMKRITSQFSFRAPDEFLTDNIRVSSTLEPQGALGDLGWYTIRFTLWAMNFAMPQWVSGRIISSLGRPDSPAPVPTEFSGEMQFDGGISAGFYNSFLTEHQQWVNISGSKGHMQISDFVLPNLGNTSGFDIENSHFNVENCLFTMERHHRRVGVREYSNNHPTAQETQLFRKFNDIVLSGKLDPHWPEISLKTQRVMDACQESASADCKRIEL